MLTLCILSLCGDSLFTKDANAAEGQVVVPVEGAAFVGELVSIDAEGRVAFRIVDAESMAAEATMPSGGRGGEQATEGKVKVMRLDELVRWGNPLAPRAQTIVLLHDGSRLMAAPDWAGGAPVRFDGDSLVVLSDAFEEVRIPRSLVRGIVLAQRDHPEQREELANEVRKLTADEETLLLTNGDELHGMLVELGGGSLTFSTQAGDVALPLSRVSAWASDGRTSVPPHSWHGQIGVGMRDGSLLHALKATTKNDELAIRLTGNIDCSGGSIDDIVFLQSLGGTFAYLSDLEPTDYRHVPYLDVGWPWTGDRGVAGGPIVVNDKRYLKGIGMHSAGRLTYRLVRAYRRFEAEVAVDDSAEGRGSVTFAVYLLRDGEWQEAFKSGVVRGGDAPVPISVDVSSAQGLTLTVDYADRGDELDRAVWLDARLVE